MDTTKALGLYFDHLAATKEVPGRLDFQQTLPKTENEVYEMERKEEDWHLNKTNLQERFKQLLCLSRWTDCTFRVGDPGGQVIRAHKLVLAVSSPVFEALFYGSMASSSDEVISIPDIDPSIFRTFLKYLYADEVNIKNIEEAANLLYTAKKYLVEQLSTFCLNYLIQHTWIKTLWDMLLIAEELSEDKLLAACLKVMSRYPYTIWGSEKENLRASTLQKLLEMEEMNMCEKDIWEMVLDWARKELETQGLEDTPDSRRALINNAGLIPKIRFLAISPRDLDLMIGVLSQHEVDALKTLTNIPPSFSIERSKRLQAPPLVWKCTRDVLSNGSQLWVSHGEVISHISSSSQVLVIGFEVFTRLAQMSSFIHMQRADPSYREKLVLFIKDPKGHVIQKTEYDSIVRFNSSQKINLSSPLWFDPNVTYTVCIGFIGGQYPICKFNDSSCKGTDFAFDEVVLVEGGPNKMACSFIISVLYAL